MTSYYDPKTYSHMNWLEDTGKRLKTADNREVEIWDYKHDATDTRVISEWAMHFRNHYCQDCDIDNLRGHRTKTEYLNEIKFPDLAEPPGPSIRSGDFCEILIADYFQWILGFWVPRLRWSTKMIRNESQKGCDVIGFQVVDEARFSIGDTLAICEAKGRLSRTGSRARLQTAIKDSVKDPIRIDESLNYLRQKFYEKGDAAKMRIVDRFQNPLDRPYTEIYSAAAIYNDDVFDDTEINLANVMEAFEDKDGNACPHPKADKLKLIVIKGANMMDLVHDLYKRAADEA